MSVYHISGLGVSPGALTVPLSAIYILQIAQRLGIKEAEDFFKTSGEIEKKGSYEKVRGEVESVIVFTSKEVIEGQEGQDVKCRSKWFGLSFENEKPEKVYRKFFSNLYSHIEKEFGFSPKKFEMYFIATNHKDFDDCFSKIGTTLRALRDKEVWANVIGGTNQINLAILSAGAINAVVSRYYYMFQSRENLSLLEPEWAEKPNKGNIRQLASEALRRWIELPIFNLEIGRLLKELNELFEWREKVNEKELENKLAELGFDKIYLAKLRRILVYNEDGTVTKGAPFERFVNFWKSIEDISNFSEWKKWAERKGILYKAEIF